VFAHEFVGVSATIDVGKFYDSFEIVSKFVSIWELFLTFSDLDRYHSFFIINFVVDI